MKTEDISGIIGTLFGIAIGSVIVALSVFIVSSFLTENPSNTNEGLQPSPIENVHAEETEVEKEFNRRFAKLQEEQEAFEKKWPAVNKEEATLDVLAEMLTDICTAQYNQEKFVKWVEAEFEKETLPLRTEIEAHYNKSLGESVEGIKKRELEEEEKAIQKLMESGVEKLIQNMKSSEEDLILRLRSIRAICKLDKQQAVLPLIELLKDEVWYIREKAAYNLGYMKDKRAVEPLIKLLNDENENVRRKARGSLATISLMLDDTDNWQEWWEKEKNKNK